MDLELHILWSFHNDNNDWTQLKHIFPCTVKSSNHQFGWWSARNRCFASGPQEWSVRVVHKCSPQTRPAFCHFPHICLSNFPASMVNLKSQLLKVVHYVSDRRFFIPLRKAIRYSVNIAFNFLSCTPIHGYKYVYIALTHKPKLVYLNHPHPLHIDAYWQPHKFIKLTHFIKLSIMDNSDLYLSLLITGFY
jgi:hypothetical protein